MQGLSTYSEVTILYEKINDIELLDEIKDLVVMCRLVGFTVTLDVLTLIPDERLELYLDVYAGDFIYSLIFFFRVDVLNSIALTKLNDTQICFSENNKLTPVLKLKELVINWQE